LDDINKMTEKINKPTKEEPEQDLNNIAEQPVNNIEPQQEYIDKRFKTCFKCLSCKCFM